MQAVTKITHGCLGGIPLIKHVREWRRRMRGWPLLRSTAGLVLLALVSLLSVGAASVRLEEALSSSRFPIGDAVLLALGAASSLLVARAWLDRRSQRRERQSKPPFEHLSPAHQLGFWLGLPVDSWGALAPMDFVQKDLAGNVRADQLCGRLGAHGIALTRTRNLLDSPLFDAWLDDQRVLTAVIDARSNTVELPVSDRMGSIGHIDLHAGQLAADKGTHRREIIDLTVSLQRTDDGLRVRLQGMTGPLVAQSVKSACSYRPAPPHPFRFDLMFEVNEADVATRVSGESLVGAIRTWMERTSEAKPQNGSAHAADAVDAAFTGQQASA